MLIRSVKLTQNDLCATSAGLAEAKRGQQRDKGIGRKPKGENTMKEKKLKVTLPVFIRSFSHDVTAAMLAVPKQ